ncbi:MAG: cyanophycin synthetase [Firmicutes bacterium]|nr:cyanophycin synthetase [Bacillota bacterium]
MKALQLRAIDGPNVYHYEPVLIMRVDLEEFTERESYEYPGLTERLLLELPGLYDHYCAMGRPGGFVERLYGGTYFGHIIEHVSLELLTQVGFKANFGKTRSAGSPGLYDIVMEYECLEATRYVLLLAMEYVQACAFGTVFPLADRLQEARRIREHTGLGPSTAALVQAAKDRDIPVRRIGSRSLLQLGTGKYRRFIQATMTHATSAVAVDIACDKALTKELLERAGIAVPYGSEVSSLEEMRTVFQSAKAPLVVKPIDGSQGRGVTMDIRDWASAERAFAVAREISQRVMVEEFIAGRQYRLLVVGGKFVAAAERLPAHVTGDGMHSIAQLVSATNAEPERGEDHDKPLTRIPLDDIALDCLARQGRSLYDVPALGETVYLRDSANLSTGGIAIDLTDHVHSGFKSIAERCARAIALDLCGVDLIAPDISKVPVAGSYAVIELNAAPGIRMHHYPSVGKPRDVAGAIIDAVFPRGAQSRVPIVSVTGTNGKTTTTRMIRHILADTGLVVGMTSTDGVYIGDECCLEGDTTGPQSAQLVLCDPRVEAAVLETARGGIMRGGLAYRAADVGIITNIALDHIGQDGITSLGDLVRVKSLVVECIRPGGVTVLNADDPELVKLAGKLKSPVVYVSLQEQNPTVSRHLARGGAAFFVRNGVIIEAAGALEWKVVGVAELPITLDGAAQFHVANALCALAAVRHLGVSRQKCVQAMRNFRSDTHNPGRINVFALPSGKTVISDYGHNPDGVRAVGEMARRVSTETLPAIIGFPGDRSDEVIRTCALTAAEYFSPIYVKEDGDTRGRRRGEVAKLITDTIREARPEIPLTVEYDECEALRKALATEKAAPILYMFHEHLEPVRAVLEAAGGQETGHLEGVHENTAVDAM